MKSMAMGQVTDKIHCCREKAPFMLLVEVLSNDQGSVREDAKYSAGSTSASPPPTALPRKATQTKTVPRPYTPEGREQRNGHAALGESALLTTH